ncbi:MAG: Maf family protein, partial [Candidatus Omnitrophica bacterium]|nr:Maf family protein [Candidatus Omnitrophota bacterium]
MRLFRDTWQLFRNKKKEVVVKIILASLSERRSRILSDCGIEHQVMPSGVSEDMTTSKYVSELVKLNAIKKA